MSPVSLWDCPVSNIFARLASFSPFNFCQSLGRGVASRCPDLHFLDCYWSWSSFYMYIALIKVVPAVIGPYVNLGGDGSVLGESFALYPSILGCSPMQSWLLPIYLPILSCPPSCVPKGRGVLVSRDVAMVGVGRRSCPIGDHLRLFSSLLDTTQMNNAVPTSPLLQQMGHPHSYPSLGQISNPYEQQPPGKELNKYASLKAVGKCCYVSSLSLLYFSVPSRFPYPLFFFLLLFLSFLSHLSITYLCIYHPSSIYPSTIYVSSIYPSIIYLSFKISRCKHFWCWGAGGREPGAPITWVFMKCQTLHWPFYRHCLIFS